jgi:hypothetical protein
METPNRSIPRSPIPTAPILEIWTWERRIPSHTFPIPSDLITSTPGRNQGMESRKLCFPLNSFFLIPSPSLWLFDSISHITPSRARWQNGQGRRFRRWKVLTPDNIGLVFAVGDEVISSCLRFGIYMEEMDGWWRLRATQMKLESLDVLSNEFSPQEAIS